MGVVGKHSDRGVAIESVTTGVKTTTRRSGVVHTSPTRNWRRRDTLTLVVPRVKRVEMEETMFLIKVVGMALVVGMVARAMTRAATALAIALTTVVVLLVLAMLVMMMVMEVVMMMTGMTIVTTTTTTTATRPMKLTEMTMATTQAKTGGE